MAMTYRPDTLLNTADAAEFLGVKPQTLNLWRSTGRVNLPYLKVGRNVRYRRSDLEAFLASCERRHTGESE
jgi:excisionase family DNA binding protein